MLYISGGNIRSTFKNTGKQQRIKSKIKSKTKHNRVEM